MTSETKAPQFLKIAYFDEGSALDYLEAKHGGRYDKISTDIVDQIKDIAGQVGGEASTDPKILSFVMDSLLGIKGKVGSDLSYKRSSNNHISETLSSTVLSNFIEEVYKGHDKNDKTSNNHFGIFEEVKLSFVPDSITYFKTISPMLKLIKEDSLGEEMPIKINGLDQIFNDAKGYYELISKKDKDEKRVFRFNFESLRNNYRLNDLTKMNITIIGIKVGECLEEELKWETEFEQKPKYTDDNSPFADMVNPNQTHKPSSPNNKNLDIYDVILAGVIN